MNILEIRNLKFKDIIKDISFDVYRGEIVGLVGKNGVGKSTISKLISGIYNKTSGKISSKSLPFVLMQDVDYQLFSESVFSEFFLSKKDLATRGKVSKTLIDYMTENKVLDHLPDENQLSLFDDLF